MKTNSKNLAIALLGIVTIFSACQKEDIRPMNGAPVEMSEQSKKMEPDKEGVFESQLCATRWFISNFDDGNTEVKTNQTGFFTGYALEFNTHHVVIARNNERSITGKWNTTYVGGKKKLVLDFGYKPFIKLNGIWGIASHNSALINLQIPKAQGSAILTLESVNNMPK